MEQRGLPEKIPLFVFTLSLLFQTARAGARYLIDANPVTAIFITSEACVCATATAKHHAHTIIEHKTMALAACVNSGECRVAIAREAESGGVMCVHIKAANDIARQQHTQLDMAVRIIDNTGAACIGLCGC